MKNKLRMKTMAAITVAASLALSGTGAVLVSAESTQSSAASESDTEDTESSESSTKSKSKKRKKKSSSSKSTSKTSSDSSSENSSESASSEDKTSDSPKNTPPDKPDGDEAPSDAPDKPDGDAPDGAPDKPDGEAPDGNGGPGGQAPDGNGGPGGPGGADTASYDYTGDLNGTLTADGEEISSEGEEISSDTADVNTALAANGGTLTITDGTLTKSGDDTDGDSCNFYGLNSIVLAVGEESSITITDSDLSADSEGSNAVFATDNATIYASNNTIATTAGNSRGLDATYGGTIIADNMTISTEGDHSAALATDRGGGNISVIDSTLSTAGSGSPLLYSTGDIEVENVTGEASGSQIAAMEGENTLIISSSDLTSTNTDTTGSDNVPNGIFIYQSTSGDAETSTGDRAFFQAVDSTLTSAIESGAMIYLTNTTADILLSNTTLNYDDSAAKLLLISGNSINDWGTPGSNGADVNFTATEQTLVGDISVDTISSLDLYLLNNSSLTGSTEITENTDGDDSSADGGQLTVNIDGTSEWVVTEDSTVTGLNIEDGGSIVDADGNTVTIIVDGETVSEGSGEITVTVTGTYSDTLGENASEISEGNIER